MFSSEHASAPAALAVKPAPGLGRLDHEAKSAYWLRFLNGRWLVYRHERVIGNFPTEKAAMAPEFLRLLKKASRPDVDEHLVHFATAAARQLRHREK
jgi:hypothetical protein